MDPHLPHGCGKRTLNPPMTETHSTGIFFIGLIILAMILLPWLFRKLFL